MKNLSIIILTLIFTSCIYSEPEVRKVTYEVTPNTFISEAYKLSSFDIQYEVGQDIQDYLVNQKIPFKKVEYIPEGTEASLIVFPEDSITAIIKVSIDDRQIINTGYIKYPKIIREYFVVR